MLKSEGISGYFKIVKYLCMPDIVMHSNPVQLSVVECREQFVTLVL